MNEKFVMFVASSKTARPILIKFGIEVIDILDEHVDFLLVDN